MAVAEQYGFSIQKDGLLAFMRRPYFWLSCPSRTIYTKSEEAIENAKGICGVARALFASWRPCAFAFHPLRLLTPGAETQRRKVEQAPIRKLPDRKLQNDHCLADN
jgi:hypothetical protein